MTLCYDTHFIISQKNVFNKSGEKTFTIFIQDLTRLLESISENREYLLCKKAIKLKVKVVIKQLKQFKKTSALLS